MTTASPLTQNELDARLDGILGLNAFLSAWSDLRASDTEQIESIMIALHKTIEASREGLAEARRAGDHSAVRFWLLREAIDVRAFMSRFLSISETMALRESRLRAFATESIDIFFDEVFTGVDRFFEAKSEAIGRTLEAFNTRANSFADARATVCRAANAAIGQLRKVSDKVHSGTGEDDRKSLDDRGLLQRAFDCHLQQSDVEAGMKAVIDAAAMRFEDGWRKVIAEATPDIRQINAFASRAAAMERPGIRIELGAAEQTFATGMAAAVVGSVGLALGWHTFLYAMLNVFPPIAIATVAASIALAIAQRGRQHEKRLERKDRILLEMKNRFKLAVFNEKQPDFDDRTLFEHLFQVNSAIIDQTLTAWQSAICGKLTLADYRKLIGASTEHLSRIDALIDTLSPSRKDN